ncbi:hypothetical protein [Micromonospora humida]|uniref:hypothetical protein n=1 Tax=Micromonospora humida TaxID=2809018 RepID=UPI0033FFDA0A
MEKFLRWGFPDGTPPVTFDRYTGQENQEAGRRILQDPPDILLTSYVMLKLVLTRHREWDRLIGAASGLWFLVLDELHTYRGRQGDWAVPADQRSARRAVVMRTSAVAKRTTLRLVRFRLHLTLPTRAADAEPRRMIVEEALLLAFRGAPTAAEWLARRGGGRAAGAPDRQRAARGRHPAAGVGNSASATRRCRTSTRRLGRGAARRAHPGAGGGWPAGPAARSASPPRSPPTCSASMSTFHTAAKNF